MGRLPIGEVGEKHPWRRLSDSTLKTGPMGSRPSVEAREKAEAIRWLAEQDFPCPMTAPEKKLYMNQLRENLNSLGLFTLNDLEELIGVKISGS